MNAIVRNCFSYTERELKLNSHKLICHSINLIVADMTITQILFKFVDFMFSKHLLKFGISSAMTPSRIATDRLATLKACINKDTFCIAVNVILRNAFGIEKDQNQAFVQAKNGLEFNNSYNPLLKSSKTTGPDRYLGAVATELIVASIFNQSIQPYLLATVSQIRILTILVPGEFNETRVQLDYA